MADENSPADFPDKSETIRITLPPKNEQIVAKRETVRIAVPGSVEATPSSPKKETSKIPTATTAAAPTPPLGAPPRPPIGSKPFLPPPIAPKPPGGTPIPGSPAGGTPIPGSPGSGAAPKPPGLGGKPTIALKPAPSATPTPDPVSQATPKKETARITIPTEGGKPVLPKATVKMQQTQPLVSKPAPALTSAAVSQMSMPAAAAESDAAVNGLAIAATVLSFAALILAYMTFSGAIPLS